MTAYLDFTVDAMFRMMKPLTPYGFVFAATDADGNVYYLGGDTITNRAGTVRISATVAELTQGDAPVVQCACWLREQGAPFMEQALDRNGKPADADATYPNGGYRDPADVSLAVSAAGALSGYMK